MASSCEDFQPLNVPVFDGENYEYWSDQMRLLFVCQDLWDVVEKGVPVFSRHLTRAMQEEINKANKNDAKALFYIRSRLSSAILGEIAEAKTSKDAWDHLKRLYKPEEVVISIAPDPEKRPPSHTEQSIRLYQAASAGKWEEAEGILKSNPELIRTSITSNGETVLHVATAMQHTEFVKKLLDRMEPSECSDLRNNDGDAAICLAAASGYVDIAKAMVGKTKDLLYIHDKGGKTPIHIAAANGHKDIIDHFYANIDIPRFQQAGYWVDLFLALVSSDMYDFASEMLKKDCSLATARREDGMTALHLIARKPTAKRSENQLFRAPMRSLEWFPDVKGFKNTFRTQYTRGGPPDDFVKQLWIEVVKLPPEELWKFLTKPSRILFDAAASGNHNLLSLLRPLRPNLLWEQVDSNGNSVFHVAAMHRHLNIFDMIHELGGFKDKIVSHKDKGTGDNMLHQVARLPSPDRLQVMSEPVLQMEMELLWFKKVEEIVPTSYQYERNDKGELPIDIFVDSHKGLQKEAEKSMKETAGSFMVVATLIATMAFAGAFTFPGGNNGETGLPLFEKRWLFHLFIVADVAASLSSTFSIVQYLSIISPRYKLEDSQVDYALMLEEVLAPIAVAIVATIITFFASLLLIYDKINPWMEVLILIVGAFALLFLVSSLPGRWINLLIKKFFSMLFSSLIYLFLIVFILCWAVWGICNKIVGYVRDCICPHHNQR